MAKAKKKIDDKDLPIGRIAQTVVNSVIAIHGLHRAIDIGTRIHEQIIAQAKRQIEHHPDEWDERTKRQVLGGARPDVPAPPEIPAPPIV